MLTIALAVPAAALAGTPASEPPSKKAFFPAIVRGDHDRAAAMIQGDVRVLSTAVPTVGAASLSPAQFFDRVRNCYLRAFYGKDEERNQVIASWMCPLQPSRRNPNRSRVILVNVAFEGDHVRLSDYFQQDSTRPAPPPNLRAAD